MKLIAGLFLLIASSYSHADIIGHWNADGNLMDSTGVNNGEFQGNAKFSDGYENEGFFFDGVGDSVYLGEHIDVKEAFSLTAWVNLLSYSNERMIYNDESSYEMAIRGETLQFAIETTAPGGWYWVDTQIIVPLETWSFYALTYDGTTSKVYGENGELLYSTNQLSGNVVNQGVEEVNIGSRRTNVSNFHGTIDDVYLFDSVLYETDFELVSKNLYSDVSSPVPVGVLAASIMMLGLARRKNNIKK